ncbi:hypothetical protein BH10PSE14_BH10PSE14_11040 [soil metagenome]
MAGKAGDFARLARFDFCGPVKAQLADLDEKVGNARRKSVPAAWLLFGPPPTVDGGISERAQLLPQ